MYTISWEADFIHNVFEPRQEISPDMATRLANDVANGTADIYVNEENEHKRENDNELRPRPADSREETALLDEWPNWAEEIQMTSQKMNAAIPLLFQKGTEIFP